MHLHLLLLWLLRGPFCMHLGGLYVVALLLLRQALEDLLHDHEETNTETDVVSTSDLTRIECLTS